ncbi:trans-acting enoyl reductase family protein [soil metagenome]
MSNREFDVLLWGATGFTGGLVAEYMFRNHVLAGQNVRFALGGRNEAKLEEVKRGLGQWGDASAIPIVVADPTSASSMDAVAARARVVASTAGPFNAYGRELVGACARAGTHYVDITGEVTFVRHAIDQLHDVATKSGARIVPCCGFDSIPSDLGVFLAHETLVEKGSALRRAELVVVSMTGEMSGGTAASAMQLMGESAHDPAVRALLEDPHALDPRGATPGPETHELYDARFETSLGKWTAPFIMRSINARVVRRTNALLGHPYGEDFRYDERVAVGRGIAGRVRATAAALGMRAALPLLRVDGLRKIVEGRLPKPGQGPSRAKREAGSFVIKIFGVGKGSDRVEVTVRGQQDPGYGETAKMLSESALALAEGKDLPARAGVLTPASAMGDALIARLRSAGMTFDAG